MVADTLPPHTDVHTHTHIPHTYSTHTHTHTHVAPTMPQNLMVDGTGAFALNIEWDAPNDSGGRPVVNYTVEIREVVANGTPADFTALPLVTDTSPTQFRYEVRNNPAFPLSENTTYE